MIFRGAVVTILALLPEFGLGVTLQQQQRSFPKTHAASTSDTRRNLNHRHGLPFGYVSSRCVFLVLCVERSINLEQRFRPKF